MKRRFRRNIIIFLLVINPALARADLGATAVRLEPLPLARRLSVGPEAVPPDDFIDAALMFSGAGDADFPRYRGKINEAVAEVRKAFTGRENNRALADELLVFLHDKFLKRYGANETGLDRLLDSGAYNCVSASVFYLIAADAVGVAASGVRTKDHAFVKVSCGSAVFDVETTSRYGFDPGKRKEFFDEFGKTTGFVYTPPTNYADREDIGRKEMLSLILFNRIAALTEARDFIPAVGLGVDLFELIKSDETLKTLIGIFSNICRYALDSARYEAGYDILNRAVLSYREFDQLQELRRFFVRDWADALIEKKAFAEAQALARREYAQGKIPLDDYRAIMLFRFRSEAEAAARDPARGPSAALIMIAEAKKELGDDPGLLAAEKAFAHNCVVDLVEKERFGEAQEALDGFRGEKKVDEGDYLALAVSCAQRRAEATARRAGFWEALLAAEEGLSRTNRAPALMKSAGVYAYNWGVSLIQSGAFDEAAAFLAGEKAAAYLSAQTRADLALYLCTGRAEAARKRKDYPAAIAVVEEGLTTLGRKPELLRSYEVLVHNRMIEFYDAKEYDKAEETILKGLSVYPASALLKDDLAKIRKIKRQ